MRTLLAFMAVAALLAPLAVNGAESLPAALSDESFWLMVTAFSEPGGDFRYENLLSNEASYQKVIPSLMTVPAGHVYVGVGPEQNFTYIAALQPKIAFIVDIRRQNLLEHLMYKELFERSRDRAEFVSLLFSRRRPAGLRDIPTASELFAAFENAPADVSLCNETSANVIDHLMSRGFALTATDAQKIKHILDEFYRRGPKIDYGFVSAPSELAPPSYSDLMTGSDAQGRNYSYLANDENFNRIREMQTKNLIVPLVGDFAGSHTLRTVGTYVKQHGSIVTAFYVSNVEQYLKKNEPQAFRNNVSLLPILPSSVLIRFVPPSATQLESINTFRFKRGGLFHLLDGEEFSGVESR